MLSLPLHLSSSSPYWIGIIKIIFKEIVISKYERKQNQNLIDTAPFLMLYINLIVLMVKKKVFIYEFMNSNARLYCYDKEPCMPFLHKEFFHYCFCRGFPLSSALQSSTFVGFSYSSQAMVLFKEQPLGQGGKFMDSI